MPDDGAGRPGAVCGLELGDQRNLRRSGLPQRLCDQVLGPITVRMIRERGDVNLPDRLVVLRSFGTDDPEISSHNLRRT